MRFLIATGIYPPEVGGPAYYAKHLADALREKRQDVSVVTYGALKKLPMGVRHILYFLKLLPRALRAERIIALDTFSVAVPAVWAGQLLRVPVIIRTGGDFLWEQYVERTGDMVPLPYFYEKHGPLTGKERLILRLTKYVLRHAVVVFNSELQRDVWCNAYGLEKSAVSVIDNASAGPLEPLPPKRKNFLWYTRGIRFKNGDALRKAFALAQKQVPDIVLETGQLPQKELLEKMRGCYAVILPSLTELGPNYILDALRCGKPFIQTKYSGYAERFADLGLTVDPLSPEDIADKIVQLCDPAVYQKLAANIAAHPFTRTYAEVADDFIALAKKI